jgi:hypothetical protein
MDRQLGPFTVLEQTGAHSYIIALPCHVRMHPVFQVSNLRPCPTATLRHFAPIKILEAKDDEYGHDRISAVKVDIVIGCRGKYILFDIHFEDMQIPHVWHRLNEVQRRIALPHFLDLPDCLEFTGCQEYMDIMRTAHPARLPHSE